jgi:inosose dehydratase
MNRTLNRRQFATVFAAGLGGFAASPLWAALARRNLKVGHTGITWGFRPDDAVAAIRDVGSLGYHGFESFGNVIETWEERGGIGQLLEAASLPLRGAYCNVNLTDPSRRAAEVETITRWGRLIHKYGGSIAVIGPNNVMRQNYDIAEHRANIVATLNDVGMALMDVGIIGALHPHTGTCIETGEETYAVMESVDSRYVRFGPDFGQLQKAGADPVQVLRDFVSITHHVHMKDYDGGPDFLGYCPLGRGELQVEALADLCEASGNDIMIMVELDPNNPGRPMPITPLETARISKDFLRTLDYSFVA